MANQTPLDKNQPVTAIGQFTYHVTSQTPLDKNQPVTAIGQFTYHVTSQTLLDKSQPVTAIGQFTYRVTSQTPLDKNQPVTAIGQFTYHVARQIPQDSTPISLHWTVFLPRRTVNRTPMASSHVYTSSSQSNIVYSSLTSGSAEVVPMMPANQTPAMR